MSSDHANSPRLGQRRATRSTGMLHVAGEADRPENAHDGMVVFVTDTNAAWIWAEADEAWHPFGSGGAAEPLSFYQDEFTVTDWGDAKLDITTATAHAESASHPKPGVSVGAAPQWSDGLETSYSECWYSGRSGITYTSWSYVQLPTIPEGLTVTGMTVTVKAMRLNEQNGSGSQFEIGLHNTSSWAYVAYFDYPETLLNSANQIYTITASTLINPSNGSVITNYSAISSLLASGCRIQVHPVSGGGTIPWDSGVRVYELSVQVNTTDARGDQFTLTYTPIQHSEHLKWGMLYQPGDAWSRSGKTITLTDFGQKHGDPLIMEYAYRAEDTSVPSVAGPTMGVVDTQTVYCDPIPGIAVGDLLVAFRMGDDRRNINNQAGWVTRSRGLVGGLETAILTRVADQTDVDRSAVYSFTLSSFHTNGVLLFGFPGGALRAAKTINGSTTTSVGGLLQVHVGVRWSFGGGDFLPTASGGTELYSGYISLAGSGNGYVGWRAVSSDGPVTFTAAEGTIASYVVGVV